MKTYSPKPEHIERRWYVIDANERVLGRLASEAATLLRGKHKPSFAPHMDMGDHVIIVNADKVVLTGGKEQKKVAHRHSGYPGGITSTRYDRLMAERPVFVVEKAVRGMLPKNRLGRSMIKKLHVVAGPEHRHQAQRPVPYTIGERPKWEGLPARPGSAPAKAAKASGADEGTGKTTPARGTPAGTAKKPTPRKPAAKKATARKATARTATAKKATAKKTTARKPATAKKTTARKPATKATKAEPAAVPATDDSEE